MESCIVPHYEPPAIASTGSLGALAFYNNSIISGDLASVSGYIKESSPDILESRIAA
jgi:hypothetical protein